MRKLFTLCLLVFSLSASAQWQQTGSKVRYVNGLGIPTRDTAAGVAADSSQILIRPADSALYVKYKKTWLRVGGGGGSIAGSGTTNYIPKFTSSTAIGNSSIFDNGNVGIGTASPAERLELVGNILASGSAGLYPRFISTVGAKSWEIGYRSGTTNYEIREDGNTRMVIANGGNVGIGTTSPAKKLDIRSTDFIIDDATNGRLTFEVLAAQNTIYSTTTAFGTYKNFRLAGENLVFNTGSLTERMRITSAGDVGIGTTSPNVKLQSNISTSGLPATSGTAQANGALRLSSAATSGILDFGINSSNNWIQSTDATDLSQIYNLLLNPNGGNVGIGTTSPAAKLSVQGTTLINTNTDNGTDKLQVSGSARVDGGTSLYTGIFTNTSQDGGIDVRNTGTLAANRTAQLRLVNGTTLFGSNDRTYQIFNIGTGANDAALAFQYWNGTSYLERFRVAPSGRFLINTTTDNASDQLQVDGSVSIKGIRQNVLSTTTTTTINDNNYFIDCTSGTFTVNLPASSGRLGRIFVIKNSGTGTITVDGNGAETIDGAATYSLATQWSQVQIISDGTNWKIISK